jgi:hypothetical protein
MAKIREYTNQQAPDAAPLAQAARAQQVSGYESGQAIKQGFGALESGVKQVEQHVAQMETSKATADLATLHASLAADWNDRVQHGDPNDPNLAENFLTEANAKIAKIGEGLITQQGQNTFQQESARTNASLFTTAHGDQAKLAGEAAISNLRTEKNQKSNLVGENPDALQSTLDSLSDDQLAKRYPTIPRDKIGALGHQLRTEVSEAAIDGAIAKNPQAAIEALKRGDFKDNVEGTVVQRKIDLAEERIRQSEVRDRLAKEAIKTAKTEASEESTRNWASAIVKNPGMVDNKKIANDPNLTGEKIEYLYNFHEKVLKDRRGEGEGDDAPDNKRYGQNYHASLQKIYNNELTDTVDILKLPGVTTAGTDKLLQRAKEVRDSKSSGTYSHEEDALFDRTVHTQVTSPDGVKRFDGGAETDYFKYRMILDQRVTEGLKAGKTRQQLYDEKSPDYVAKDLDQYTGPKDNSAFITPTPAKPVAPFYPDAALRGIPAGPSGAKVGVAALQGAVRHGFNKDRARALAIAHGWVTLDTPKTASKPSSVPTVGP